MTHLELWWLTLPLRRPFANAGAAIERRETIVVGATDGETWGWGEAAPFPQVSPETTRESWDALLQGVAGQPGAPRTAAAAIDEARADLEARQAGRPLARLFGDPARPIRASLAIGIQPDIPTLLEEVERAVAVGYRDVKVKFNPEMGFDPAGAVAAHQPGIRVTVDCNGSLETADDAADVDRYGFAAIEQPFARTDLDAHRRLRVMIETPIILDESIRSVADAAAAVDAGAADVLSVKPGVLGNTGAVAVVALAEGAGISVKAGGMLESSIGKAHSAAVAAAKSCVFTDQALPTGHFDDDVIGRGWSLVDGFIHRPAGPGIGFEPDRDALERLSLRHARVQSPQ